ncbi:MAG: SelT/SelW/SelH family protein, partial [Pseudomonadota bacterium]
SGGIFEVRLNGEVLWNKKAAGRYPEPKEIKQLIRDRIDPSRDLGHSDRKS